MREIVSTEWLNQNLSNSSIIILDASITTGANGKEFKKFDLTIPNARFFDLQNVFLDKTSPFPNTIPKPEQFELECRKLGINKDSEIVVFDNNGIYSSPRVYWLFKVMGHQKISFVDGGLPDCIEKRFQTEKKRIKTIEIGDFEVQFNETLVVDFEWISINTIKKKFTIVDARSESRFNGIGKEPREHFKKWKN
ncbi:sulfurtransferase [Flagellimonas lutimaris]|uniref:sulfurtransferase n=1 Tax=Flagellimonas lutimaris TaxID=475082 RepID=UPI0016041C9C|nr:rhodanese-like domain-containing protein [Allomuricauda lutimaris]